MCVPLCQSGDEECLAAWGRICAASRKEFQAIYDRLGVTLTERGESFYNPMLKGETWRGGGGEEGREGGEGSCLLFCLLYPEQEGKVVVIV